VFWVPFLQKGKIFIDLNALFEVCLHLEALWDLTGTLNSIVIEALNVHPFVRKAGKFVVGLDVIVNTLYSWKVNGTSLTLLR